MIAKTFVKSFAILMASIFCILTLFSSYNVYGATISGNLTIHNYLTNVSVNASDYATFECNETGRDALLLVVLDPYTGINEVEPVTVYYLDASNRSAINEDITDSSVANRTRVVLEVNQSNSFNMSFDPIQESWRAYLSNNESIDLNITFRATSSSYKCINNSDEIKIRDPFYLTLHFYKSNNSFTSTNTELYQNEFQYVYLRFENGTTGWTDSTIFRDMSYLDRIFRGLPFYQASFTAKADDTLTFWDRYENGEAIIKLYEPYMNYSVWLMTDDTYGLQWTDEFTRPQLQDSSWQSLVIPKLQIQNNIDTTLGIYLSQWEINKFLFLMNIGYWILVFVIWFILMLVMSRAGVGAIVGFTLIYFVLMKLIGLAIF